ncbi:MAG: hypothetical protein JSS63_07870 [Bacteroidetes bacterium]|nr:hypothetical protein [Bacteroidota bacterium]
MDWISVSIEEFKILHTECQNAIQTQHSILRYGTTVIGILLGSAFNLWDRPVLPGVIFFIFLPIICSLVQFIWLGELARMMRAGKYLMKIETNINIKLTKHNMSAVEEEKALNFSNWLRNIQENGKTPQLKYNYVSIIILFIMLSIGSIALGNYYSFLYWYSHSFEFYIVNAVEILFLISVGVFQYKIIRENIIVNYNARFKN